MESWIRLLLSKRCWFQRTKNIIRVLWLLLPCRQALVAISTAWCYVRCLLTYVGNYLLTQLLSIRISPCTASLTPLNFFLDQPPKVARNFAPSPSSLQGSRTCRCLRWCARCCSASWGRTGRSLRCRTRPWRRAHGLCLRPVCRRRSWRSSWRAPSFLCRVRWCCPTNRPRMQYPPSRDTTARKRLVQIQTVLRKKTTKLTECRQRVKMTTESTF